MVLAILWYWARGINYAKRVFDFCSLFPLGRSHHVTPTPPHAWILRLTLLAAAGLPVGLPFASAQAQDYSIVYTFGSGGIGAT
jgi:hypothetical protein